MGDEQLPHHQTRWLLESRFACVTHRAVETRGATVPSFPCRKSSQTLFIYFPVSGDGTRESVLTPEGFSLVATLGTILATLTCMRNGQRPLQS